MIQVAGGIILAFIIIVWFPLIARGVGFIVSRVLILLAMAYGFLFVLYLLGGLRA